ncbi:hypothetical protein [Paractinoplanes maris]|uniref:hypothetical protein n=1 Tax=Paractinoplanes maris TaxID=1734446 RepID=UPI002021B7E3|nr:hypothetical protein [Actinoplanes maris]
MSAHNRTAIGILVERSTPLSPSSSTCRNAAHFRDQLIVALSILAAELRQSPA